jgi:hypothetical protein
LFWRQSTHYTITPSVDGSFITIKVRGDITRQAAAQMNLEAHALGEQLKVNRYLVDVTEARNVDLANDDYQFANVDMKNMDGIDKSAFVATVVSPGDHSHDFMETVCRNAGLNVRIFTDLAEAIRFLMRLGPRERPDPDEDVGGGGSK